MVEETWRIVQPLIDEPCELEPYEPRELGPRGRREPDARPTAAGAEPWLPEEPLETVGAG